jgi:hypothetical protein
MCNLHIPGPGLCKTSNICEQAKTPPVRAGLLQQGTQFWLAKTARPNALMLPVRGSSKGREPLLIWKAGVADGACNLRPQDQTAASTSATMAFTTCPNS